MLSRATSNPSPLVLYLVLFALASTCASAATLTPYPTEAAFQSAIGPGFIVEKFDSYPSGTLITTQVPHVSFSSINAGGTGFVPIQTSSSPGSVSSPNMLGGGYLAGTPDVNQVIVMDYSPSIFAVGFYLAAQAPDASGVTIKFDFIDGTSSTYTVTDTDQNQNTGEFLGIKADTRFLRATLTSGKSNNGQGGFSKFGIDNLTIAEVEQRLPVCFAAPVEQGGVLGVNGGATDSAQYDTGIVSVNLTNATNVSLTCDAPLPSSCGSVAPPVAAVSWRATATNTQLDGKGTVVATDAAGNACSVPVTFRAVPAGPVSNQVLCEGPGLLFLATNQNATAADESACTATPFGPGEPDLPFGYEPSLATDPNPCKIFTIDSPISGLTEMVYKKDGAFEPRLRLLFSRFDGASFPPFTDITESVEEIATVIPDPSRLKGGATWSLVKVACAIQSEICNGLDDDGDGFVDEGLPTGDHGLDADEDGYPLCPSDLSLADCNDQVSSINPGAAEVCNGLNDDCDLATDEGNPAGGAACAYAGVRGACAAGVTSCASGPMT
ncbi:MAG TPA: putative metal-binding motif-containing protein, partial [Candidatus Polarisedimenticolia bacterium]|nr:putative metal-binding motif-containing protein [Candidatus Polarisedimenticolia bacterium]